MSQKQRRVYSAEFKRDIVRSITEKSTSISQASRRYGINENVLRRWKHQVQRDGASAFPGKGRRNLSNRELQRLKKENQRLLLEREILTSASLLLREPTRRRYAFIHSNSAVYPVCVMCDVLNVSRSGYYAYAKSMVESAPCRVDSLLLQVGAGVGTVARTGVVTSASSNSIFDDHGSVKSG